SVSFYTRSRVANNNFTVFPDRIYVLYSPTGEINTGDCTGGFGDFTETLMVINPDLTTDITSDPLLGYPLLTWEQFTTEVSGNGRVAFLYYVENAGAFGDNSNYIGIDSVEWVLAPNTPEDTTPQTPKNCLSLKGSLCNENKKLEKRIGKK
ncbi:MAG: choice-of-anchor J domain-containing protein, partial [Methylococcales bacterium]